MRKFVVMLSLMTAGIAVFGAQSAAEKLAADKTQISLADARGKIDKAIESPAVMGELMKRLSAGDQVKFLADVNKAIGDMPASIEEKTAKFLNLNHVALKSAQAGNTTALLAEVFATVSPEALTVISERFAADLVNRAANPNVTYTDEQYAKISAEVLKAINERTEETDNGSTRSVFAILMFLRGSNETGDALEKLQEQLIGTLKHDDAKELAKEEWIPAALGKDGREQGYEPLLASADAGRRPDFDQVFLIAGPQYLDPILEDLGGKNTDRYSYIRTRTPMLDAVGNPLNHMVPVLHDEPHGGDPGVPFDSANPGGRTPTPPPPPPMPHPGPYSGQWF